VQGGGVAAGAAVFDCDNALKLNKPVIAKAAAMQI